LFERGVYVAQPIDEDGNSPDEVAINGFNQTIHDCAERFAMVLSIDSLSQCCGAGNKCIRFLAAYCNGGARNNSRDVTPGEWGSMDNDNRERDISGTRGNKTKSITSVNQKDEDYQ
jgi:hypothetical protein